MLNTSDSLRLAQLEQFADIRLFQIWPFPALEISPDGAQVAYSINTSGQFNLWIQATEENSNPRQLTLFEDAAVRKLTWKADSQTLAFCADQNGDELYQLYTISEAGGPPEKISKVPDAQYIIGGWSPDGKYLAYTTNDRDRSENDVVIREMATGAEQRLISGGNFSFVGWSPDNQSVLVKELVSNTHTNLYLARPGREPVLLTNPTEEAVNIPAGWATSGKSFYLISDAGREFKGLALYDLADNSWHYLETPEWDVEDAVVSANRKRVAWLVNEDGYSVLHVSELESGQKLKLPPLAPGVIMKLSFSANGEKLAFLAASATHPFEVYVLDLEKGTSQQLTNTFPAGLDETQLVEAEVVRFPGFDGRRIPTFLYKPKNVTGKAPVLFSIHGGPEFQERLDYSNFSIYPGLYQYLLSRGIAVLATNIRGSTGYGKSYQKLIHRDWGGGELKDIEAAVSYLHSLDWVDAERIGVFGASFGGFATLSAVSRLPDLWRVGVEWYGPANLISFVQSVPPSWRSAMEAWVGDAEKDREMLIERSPLTHAARIKVPLLIVQGSKDWRVVKAESDQMVEKLQALGREVKYQVYEEEGHGFLRKETMLDALKHTVEWLEQWLLDRK